MTGAPAPRLWRRPAVQRALVAVAVLLLVGLTLTGLADGSQQIRHAETPGQRVQTVSQLAYGVLSVLAIVTRFWWQRRARLVLALWAVTVTMAGGLASVVWGGTTVAMGLVSAVASGVVALVIIWMLRAGLAE